eukprot:scaffold86281_cov27-Tisochrysis_lutea.AAC.2
MAREEEGCQEACIQTGEGGAVRGVPLVSDSPAPLPNPRATQPICCAADAAADSRGDAPKTLRGTPGERQLRAWPKRWRRSAEYAHASDSSVQSALGTEIGGVAPTPAVELLVGRGNSFDIGRLCCGLMGLMISPGCSGKVGAEGVGTSRHRIAAISIGRSGKHPESRENTDSADAAVSDVPELCSSIGNCRSLPVDDDAPSDEPSADSSLTRDWEGCSDCESDAEVLLAVATS